MTGRSLILPAVVLAGCGERPREGDACRAERVLDRAAEAYRAAPSLTGIARYEVRVPGAPPKMLLDAR